MKFLSILLLLSTVVVVSAHKPHKPSKPKCSDPCFVPGQTKCAKMGDTDISVKCIDGCWTIM
jgi:hypothetical protein